VQLHLTPLLGGHVLQMRPDLRHVDELDAARKQAEAAAEAAALGQAAGTQCRHIHTTSVDLLFLMQTHMQSIRA
jgi:hypothetical protein